MPSTIAADQGLRYVVMIVGGMRAPYSTDYADGPARLWVALLAWVIEECCISWSARPRQWTASANSSGC
ncbi:hypothetical protein AWV63_13585 [Micromonospora rifamycinica]|nr:hypothetical protein AWV63_13585 [Micromonospora rifamycinica]